MNIKPIIIATALFCGASFSAYADLITIYQGTYGSISSGLTLERSQLFTLVQNNCGWIGSGYWKYSRGYNLGGSNATFRMNKYYDAGCTNPTGSSASHAIHFNSVSACPDGKVFNPQNGICEEPPEEEFCESQKWDDIVLQETESCAARYPNHFTKVTPSCTDENNYSVQCEQGFPKPAEPDDPKDPTEPITPPSGDFGGGSSGTANPDLPDFDKPEPDSPTPESNTDTAVMEAIRNLNRDNNAALKGINTDVNKGFTDINNQLTELNGTSKALGQSVVDQMNQDYQIYQGNKQLMLQQTGTIAGVTKAVNAQTGVLKNSVDGLGSNIDGLGTKLDHIKEIIGETAPCDPNSDSRGCEGNSGMTTKLASDVATQINSVVGSGFDDAEKEVTGAVQGFIDDSKLAPVEGHMYEAVNIAMSALPSAGDCAAFSMPSLFGDRVDFGCEFSVKFKAVASFLMYIYTIWTLIDILLNGVTPAAGTVPHRSRGI